MDSKSSSKNTTSGAINRSTSFGISLIALSSLRAPVSSASEPLKPSKARVFASSKFLSAVRCPLNAEPWRSSDFEAFSSFPAAETPEKNSVLSRS